MIYLRINTVYNDILYDVILDLYDYEPVKLSLTIDEFSEAKPKTDYSQAFRIPATTKNQKVFRDLFEVNGYDFDVTKKINAILQDENGAEFRRGELRLFKIYVLENNKVDYECAFFGTSRDLFSSIGDKSLCELNLSDLSHIFTIDNIEQSWQAYPEGSFNDGLFNGDILYPIVDFGDDINSDGSLVNPPSFNILQASNIKNTPLNIDRIKPMIRAKAVFDRIFEQAGYEYESEFLNDDIIQRLYVSAWGNNNTTINENSSVDSYTITPNISVNINNIVPSSWDYPGNPSGPLDISGAAIISYTFPHINNISTSTLIDYGNNNQVISNALNDITFPSFNSSNNRFALLNDGTTFDSLVSTYEFDQFGVLTDVPQNYFVPQSPGFYEISMDFLMQMRMDGSSSMSELFYDNYKLQFGYASLNNDSSFVELDSYTFIEEDFDLISPNTYLINKNISAILDFTSIPLRPIWVRLVYIPNGFPELENLGNFFYQLFYGGPWNRIKIVSLGNLNDITVQSSLQCDLKQIDFIKDFMTKFRLLIIPDNNNPNRVKIEPWKDYISSGEVKDWTKKLDINTAMQIEPLFGIYPKRIIFEDKPDGDFFNDLNIKTFDEPIGTKIFDSGNQIIIGEKKITTNFSPTAITQARGYSGGTEDQEVIWPHVYNNEFKPIKPKTRLLFYNGLKDIYQYQLRQIISPDVAIVESFVKYPLVTNATTFPLFVPSFDINWEREVGYVQNPISQNINNGFSTYDIFWKEYTELIYNREARRIQCNLYLTPKDINEFEFSDVIYLKDAYYFVEKLEDIEVGKSGLVKATLIKLINYKPQLSATLNLNIWNLNTDNWNNSLDTWDD